MWALSVDRSFIHPYKCLEIYILSAILYIGYRISEIEYEIFHFESLVRMRIHINLYWGCECRCKCEEKYACKLTSLWFPSPKSRYVDFPSLFTFSLLLPFVVFYTHRIMSILLIWEVVSIKVLLEYIIRRFILTIFRFWRMGRRRRQWGCLMRMVCLFISLFACLLFCLFLGGFVVWRMGEQLLVWLFVILFEVLNLWIRIPEFEFPSQMWWAMVLNLECSSSVQILDRLHGIIRLEH